MKRFLIAAVMLAMTVGALSACDPQRQGRLSANASAHRWAPVRTFAANVATGIGDRVGGRVAARSEAPAVAVVIPQAAPAVATPAPAAQILPNIRSEQSTTTKTETKTTTAQSQSTAIAPVVVAAPVKAGRVGIFGGFRPVANTKAFVAGAIGTVCRGAGCR